MTSSPTLALTLPQTVVITGAASGLGYELSGLLLEAGCAVIGVDRAAAVADLAGAVGYSHVEGGVSDEGTWRGVEALLEAAGATSLGLVTAAAILDVGTILGTSKQMLARTLDVNVVGTALAIKALLPRMIANGGGPIVVVGSLGDLRRTAAQRLFRIQGGGARAGPHGGHGPCAPGHPGQCAEPRPDDGGPVQAASGVGGR